jgi:anti-sigma factor RsiW
VENGAELAPNLTCRELVEFLADYLSGELPAPQRAAFNGHLAECPPCVAYMKSYDTVARLGRLAAAEDAPVPPDVPEALVQAILSARRDGA